MSFSELISILGIFLPVISLIVMVGLFWYAASGKRKMYLVLYVPIIAINLAILSIVEVYSSGSGNAQYFAECMPPVIGVLFLFFYLGFRFNPQKRHADKMIGWLEIIVAVLLIFSFLYVPFAGNRIIENCENYQYNEAAPIIAAMEKYKGKNSDYPESLNSLVPDYIAEIPTPFCLKPYHWKIEEAKVAVVDNFIDYTIKRCAKDIVFLVVRSPESDYYQVYDFRIQDWKSYEDYDLNCVVLE
ncbi:MAG: hypothetical protein ACOYZ6_19355 [Chloroflexota bacterium]